jgi:hypothetical protein
MDEKEEAISVLTCAQRTQHWLLCHLGLSSLVCALHKQGGITRIDFWSGLV